MVNTIMLILRITTLVGLIMNLISPSAVYALIGYASLLIVSVYDLCNRRKKSKDTCVKEEQ